MTFGVAPGGGVSSASSFDRRRSHRVRLAVLVRFGREANKEEHEVCPRTGWSVDLSPHGLYFTSGTGEPLVPGEVLRVSIEIPVEMRERFPFSHIIGSGRLVRIEPDGLALAFCEDRLTLLGSIA